MSDLYSNSGAAPTKTRSAKLFNIREEARAAILSEQLSYLLGHGGACTDGCPACARLNAVEEMLMQPFRVKSYSPAA